MSSGWSPTQYRLINCLSDGLPHTREELRLLVDEVASYSNLNGHLVLIRKVLRPQGQDVICELTNGRAISYRQVRLLRASSRE